MTKKNIKILIISKYFLPRNTAGVYRVVAFLKYFGENGIDCTALVSATQDVQLEGKLSRETPENVEVHKAKEISVYKIKNKNRDLYFHEKVANKLSQIIQDKLIPVDPFMLWVPYAFLKAKKLLLNDSYDAVLVTTPPSSTQLIGVLLKKIGAKYFIADFRDSWSHQGWAPPVSWLSKLVEKVVLKNADLIVANTPLNKTLLEKDYQFTKGKVVVIPNGYFPDDLVKENSNSNEKNKIFRLVYTGELYEGMFEAFAQSIKLLKDKHPDLSKYFIAEFAGLMYEENHELLRKLNIQDVFKYHGFISYDESIELVRSADIVLFCLQNTPLVSNWVPSKLYFYLGQKKPILALVPEGDAANIIKSVNAGFVFLPDDHISVANKLESLIFSENENSVEYDICEWKKYSRQEQVRRLSVEIKKMFDGGNNKK